MNEIKIAPKPEDMAGSPPNMLRHIFKINLFKTLRHKSAMGDVFGEFRDRHPVGSKAPEFELHATDGRMLRLGDFRDKKHVVLEFGSYA